MKDRRLLGHMTRGLFLVAVGVGAWWSLRGQGDGVTSALATATIGGLLLSLVLVVSGLAVTGLLWRRIFGLHGARVTARDASAIFFVGQLGKYVPGSVWSIGVQARMAQAHEVGPRATVSTSLVFLWVHVATGCLAAGIVLPWVPRASELPGGRWAAAAAFVVVGVLCLVPAVVHRAARLLAGSDEVVWRLRDTGWAVGLMAAAWIAYSAALLALVPAAEHSRPLMFAALLAAFALGYVAGVAVPVAPAGLGAREGIFVLVLAPALGLAPAAAVALLARVVHTVADFAVALVAWRSRHAG